ncbi:unnamed protein product, partial [Vitis vinifera]
MLTGLTILGNSMIIFLKKSRCPGASMTVQ